MTLLASCPFFFFLQQLEMARQTSDIHRLEQVETSVRVLKLLVYEALVLALAY